MISRFYIAILCWSVSIMGCNDNGLFGHSETKEEARANGSTIIEYVPNKKQFSLLDGTNLRIDTAWTEMSFTYKNGKKVFDSTYGFNFAVPYKSEPAENYSFTFSLADSNNMVFTNGREANACQLHPRVLYDTIRVFLEQKDPDTSFGWLKPIISDTIVFIKSK